MRGGGFLSRMPASYGDTMAGLMKRRNMALPTAPMLFWGKRWLTTCARTSTHNGPALSSGQGPPKAPRGKPSQAFLPHRARAAAGLSRIPEKQTQREGLGLSTAAAPPQLLLGSPGRDAAPRAPGRVSELSPRRALPRRDPTGASGVQCPFHPLGP